MNEDSKKCSKCKTFPQNLIFLRTFPKKIVKELLAKFAVKNIIMIIKIEY